MKKVGIVLTTAAILLAGYGLFFDIIPSNRFKAKCMAIEGAVPLRSMDGLMICVQPKTIIFKEKL